MQKIPFTPLVAKTKTVVLVVDFSFPFLPVSKVVLVSISGKMVLVWMQFFCLQLEVSCLQLSFFAYSCVWCCNPMPGGGIKGCWHSCQTNVQQEYRERPYKNWPQRISSRGTLRIPGQRLLESQSCSGCGKSELNHCRSHPHTSSDCLPHTSSDCLSACYPFPLGSLSQVAMGRLLVTSR